jgi:hypothetical protein
VSQKLVGPLQPAARWCADNDVCGGALVVHPIISESMLSNIRLAARLTAKRSQRRHFERGARVWFDKWSPAAISSAIYILHYR